MQKPLIKFAWDVQAFMEQLQRVKKAIRTRGGGVSVLGGTAILLRQIFAEKGQMLVGDAGVALAVAGGKWDRASLTKLCSDLETLNPRDRMKRKGRMSQYSGPTWVRGVFRTTAGIQRFQRAAELVGGFLVCDAPAPSAFHGLCVALKSTEAKLPGVSAYSIPHLARACYVGRAFIRGDGVADAVEIDEEAWSKDLRVMHKDRTRGIFDLLKVDEHADALALQGSIAELARRVWSTSVARHYASVSLVDLPCAACEFGGVLGAVRSIHGGGDAQAVQWLLQHLPGRLPALKAMGESLKKITAKVDGRGDGLDRQCSGTVTRAWLKDVPQASSVTMESVFIRGGGDKFFRMPSVTCPSCDCVIQPRWRGRKRAVCDACYRARVRAADAKRQAKRRRMQ